MCFPRIVPMQNITSITVQLVGQKILISSGEFSNALTTCSMPIGECLNYGQYALWQVRLQCVPIDLYHMIKRMVHSNVPGLE